MLTLLICIEFYVTKSTILYAVYVFAILISSCLNHFQVPAETKAEANKPSLTSEEMKLKAQELRFVFFSILFIILLNALSI